MTLKCPFDDTPMAMRRGLPEWLDVNKLVGQHPMPLLGGYIKNRLQEASRTIEKNVHWASCPKCGYIALFEG